MLWMLSFFRCCFVFWLLMCHMLNSLLSYRIILCLSSGMFGSALLPSDISTLAVPCHGVLRHRHWTLSVSVIKKPCIVSAIVQAWCLPVRPHCVNARWNRCQEDLNIPPPPGELEETPGRPRTTWMKVIQQDLKSNNLSLNAATDVAQNRPLWRLMSMFGAVHS